MAEAPLSPAAMQNDPSDATGSDSAGLPEKRRSADRYSQVPFSQGRPAVNRMMIRPARRSARTPLQALLASGLGVRWYTPLQAESIIDAAIEVRFIWPEQLR